MLQIYRFDPVTDGEVAIPSGLFAKDHLDSGSWPAHQPPAGEWIWRDGNGNGAFEPTEYDVRNPSSTSDLFGWWVDDNGVVWQANREEGIRYFPMQGLDEHNNPTYTYNSMQTIPLPEPFAEPGGDLQRIEYDSDVDVMYLGGYTAKKQRWGDEWGLVGPVVARYDDWSTGNRTPRWQIELPYSKSAAQSHVSCRRQTLRRVHVYSRGIRLPIRDRSAPRDHQPRSRSKFLKRMGRYSVRYPRLSTPR